MKKVKKIVFILVLIVFVIILGVYGVKLIQENAKKDLPVSIQEEYTNKEVPVSASISDAIQNGYEENIDMDYQYSDEIGLKVNSIFVSDNNMGITFDFKFGKEVSLNNKMLAYSYIIYNEKNEVYSDGGLTNKNLIEEFCKEKEIKIENYKNNTLNMNSNCITYTKDHIVMANTMTAKEFFPKSSKLYVKVNGIGIINENGKYQSLTNSNWKLEIELPEKFWKEEVVEYELKTPIQGIEIERAVVSTTSMTLIAKIEEINKNTTANLIDGRSIVYLMDEKDQKYNAEELKYDETNLDRLTTHFPINKNMATEKLYLKTYIRGEETTIELVKK